jgi:NitT/TauT family transport system permease protein
MRVALLAGWRIAHSRIAHSGIDRETAWAVGLPVALGVFVLAAWQLATNLAHVPQVLLPAPDAVIHGFAGIGADLAHHARATGMEALIAFVLATLLGLVAAVVLSSSSLLFEAVYPNLVVFQIIPKIALAPLFTFWLGIAAPSRITYAVFISFFPVALATMTGLARTDPNMVRLCRALTAGRWQSFFHVRIPYAMPYFFSGMKVAATMSIVGIVVGEFISAREGLGYYILLAESRGETAHVFDALVLLCMIGLAIYAIAQQAERLARVWWRG